MRRLPFEVALSVRARRRDRMTRPATLVSAGAGSGKTHWIVEHVVARVLAGTPIDRIAAVTFTDAAAAELRSRLRAGLLRAGAREQASRVDAAAICTIHRFSLELLKRYPTAVGLPPEPLVLDERAAEQLREEALESALASWNTAALDALLDGLGPGLGLSERGRDDQDTPVGRLRALIRSVLDKARSVAMDPAKLRVESALAASRLIDALGPPSVGATALDSSLAESIAEAVTFVRTKREPATQKDRPLWTALAAIDDDGLAELATSQEARARLAVMIASGGSFEASKQFAPGAALKGAAERFCRDHPWLRERIASVVRGAIELSAMTAEAYARSKRRLGAVDFDDMQSLALALLEGRAPASLAYAPLVASTLDLVVVDEFQDSAPLQYRLFEALRSQGVELSFVGDLKQAIYGFRAADSALFAALLEEASEGAQRSVLRLSSSRRSRPELVEFANDLFDALFARTSLSFDRLDADNDYTRRPIEKREPCIEVIRHGLSERGAMVGSKARAVAGRLHALIEQGAVLDRETGALRRVRWSDVTVLARTHAQLARWARELREHGIPAALEHGPWFETVEAQLGLAWLRMVASPRDSAASASVLVSELYGISQRSMAALHARGLGGSPAFAVELHRADPTSLSLSDVELRALERCARDLSFAREAFRTRPLVEAVELALARVELSLKLSLRCDEAGAAQVSANVRALSEVASQLAQQDERALSLRESPGRTLEALIVELEALRDALAPQPRSELSRDAVSLVTMHASKGLEFAIVVLDALGAQVEPRLPRVELRRPPTQELLSQRALEQMGIDLVPSVGPTALKDKLASVGDAAGQLRDEQLRLLYVAMTRAREHLLLLWPEESKTPSQTRYVRDLVTDAVARPPSAAGECEWTLASGGRPHRVLVVHAASRAADGPTEEQPLDAGWIARYRAVIDEARARSTRSSALDRDPEVEAEPKGAVAQTLTPTELVHIDDCPEVVRLSLLHPAEHRIARSRSIAIDVRAIGSARAERLALAQSDPAQLGRWVHAALATALVDGVLDERALDRALTHDVPTDDRAAVERFVRSSIASVREALSMLAVREVLGHELSFVVEVEGTLLKGSIDLLVRCAEGLRVLDVKTHPLEPSAFERNAAYYRAQLDAYAYAAEKLTGERVVGRDLLLPSSGALLSLREPFERSAFERSVRAWGALAATGARGPGPGADCARCPWSPLCRVVDDGD